MTRKTLWVFPIASLVLSSCTLPAVAPEAATEFKATGTIQRGNRGASFDASRVVSPNITVSKRSDGSWAGHFAVAGSGASIPIDVSITDKAVRGIGLVLLREELGDGHVVISGSFDQRASGGLGGERKNFRFELSPDRAIIHTTRSEFELETRSERPDGSTLYGQGDGLILTGEAARLEPLAWPQMALALFAAFY